MNSVQELDEYELYCDVEDDCKEEVIEDINELNIGYSSDSEDDTNEEDYSLSIKNRDKKAQKTQEETSNIKYQPTDKLFHKYMNKLNFDSYNISNRVNNQINESQKKIDDERIRRKDKQDRATSEQVMDPRVRMILFKLLNTNLISEVHGCISTGKEANVYYATGPNEGQYAIKIYKTSILTFKKRDKYVSGEFRWRHGYCKQNPRKMVGTWAEKEMRNLQRLYSKGIIVPQPILLRSNVLVMTFIGEDGWPAQKLKDAPLNQSKAREIYRDIIVMMWKMFNLCKLVHGDLSEFNILYTKKKELCIIDVSQSVEHDHPRALDFLKIDCKNINDYFKKFDVATLSLIKLFEFVTDGSMNEEEMEKKLDELAEESAEKAISGTSAKDQIEEEVFRNAFIPQQLNDVIHYERDHKNSNNQVENLIYKTIIGTKLDSEKESQKDDSDQDENSEDSAQGEDEEGDDDGKSKFVNSARPKDESLEEKKARKKQVREEKAEKRKEKMKKHVKKRQIKLRHSNK
nr:serine/threonine-protein kinase RIO1 [Onthophagus taurus]